MKFHIKHLKEYEISFKREKMRLNINQRVKSGRGANDYKYALHTVREYQCYRCRLDIKQHLQIKFNFVIISSVRMK